MKLSKKRVKSNYEICISLSTPTICSVCWSSKGTWVHFKNIVLGTEVNCV